MPKQKLIEGEKFARKCSITGEGMNAGFVFIDGMGDKYIKDEKNAKKEAKKSYKSLKESHLNDNHYWTEWEMPEDAQYIVKNGKLVDIE